jgi:hypothetical protein
VPRLSSLLVTSAAALAGALALVPAAGAATQPAQATKILRIGPAQGRVVVKIQCAASTASRTTPLSGQYTLTTTDGTKVADGGFNCQGASSQYAYATVVGSEDETIPGTGPDSKKVIAASKLVVQLREIAANGRYVRLGGAKTLPISGWLLADDVEGLSPASARSTGATGANHAPTLFLHATPTMLESCGWKVVPIGGPDSDVTSDPDGDALTISWYADGRKIHSQPLASADGSHLAVFKHTFPKLGVHHVKVVVSDTHGASTTQTLKLTCVSSKGG